MTRKLTAIICFFIIAVVVGSIFLFNGFIYKTIETTQAAGSENVKGFAWSENIGWISFNSVNCDSDDDGVTDQGNYPQCSVGDTIANYGVHINPDTGIFSGYAWSENIGWISFNSSDLAGCPSDICQAKLSPTKEISGWARAYRAIAQEGQTLGGWDGWIKLRGTIQAGGTYGVSLNDAPVPMEFRGWAWAGNDIKEEAVVGWISFNCLNTGVCATQDYKVMTDLTKIPENVAPVAVISCDPLSCSVYSGTPLLLINDSTDNDSTDFDNQNDIEKSKWFIDGGFKYDCPYAKGCNLTPNTYVGPGLYYTAELYVEDTATNSDTATKEFQIKRDITAGFMCSLNNTDWEVCEEIVPVEGDRIYFLDLDDPSLLEHSIASEGAYINSRIWNKGGVSFWSGNEPNPFTTADPGSMEIELSITDSEGRGPALMTHTISGAEEKAPEYEEE